MICCQHLSPLWTISPECLYVLFIVWTDSETCDALIKELIIDWTWWFLYDWSNKDLDVNKMSNKSLKNSNSDIFIYVEYKIQALHLFIDEHQIFALELKNAEKWLTQ